MPAQEGINVSPAGSTDRHPGCAMVASIVVALGISVFLLSRRVSGGFTSPLPVPQMLATAVIVVVWSLLLRRSVANTRQRLVAVVAVLTLFNLALACSYPGSRTADWIVWPFAMIVVAFSSTLANALPRAGPDGFTRRMRIGRVSGDNFVRDTTLQQLARVRTVEGVEMIHGTLVAELASGERQYTLFVAFCPPFEQLPIVEAEIADDSDALVTVAHVLHNGAQFEVRLPQPPSEPARIAVEFQATCAT